jgi:hypothetical protein
VDKLLNVTNFGTTQENELGFQADDQRGRQEDAVVNRLFPATGSGGGQSSQPYVVNRYRPGNKYKYVRLNGTVAQYNAVKYDVSFATESQRMGNVINVAANDNLGNSCDGIVEFGDGGPLLTDPALTSHVAGVFGFMTTGGEAIANVNAAVVADDLLAPATVAGRLDTIAVTTPTAAETRRISNMAGGKGIKALVTEPPAQPSTWKANLTRVFIS